MCPCSVIRDEEACGSGGPHHQVGGKSYCPTLFLPVSLSLIFTQAPPPLVHSFTTGYIFMHKKFLLIQVKTKSCFSLGLPFSVEHCRARSMR